MGKIVSYRQVEEDLNQRSIQQEMSNQISFKILEAARNFTNFFRLLRSKLSAFFHYDNATSENGTQSFDYNRTFSSGFISIDLPYANLFSSLRKEVSENKREDKSENKDFVLVEERTSSKTSQALANAFAADINSIPGLGEKENIEKFIQEILRPYNKANGIFTDPSDMSESANPGRKDLEFYDKRMLVTDKGGQVYGRRLVDKVKLRDPVLSSFYRVSSIVTGVFIGVGVGVTAAIGLSRYFGLWSSLKRRCFGEVQVPMVMYQPVGEGTVKLKDERPILTVMTKI